MRLSLFSKSASADGQKLWQILNALLTASLAIYAFRNWFKTAKELRRFYTNMWVWDPWDYLSHFERYKHFDLSVLWIQHNEHREIGTEVAYILDVFLFQGRQFLPELAGIVSYLGALGIMIASVAAVKRSWLTVSSALLAFGLAGYKTCAVSLNIPFLMSWPQWEFFAVAALAMTVLHARRGDKVSLAAALGFATATEYSMANGLLVWPLLLAASLVLGYGQKKVWLMGLYAAIASASYFFHYRHPQDLNWRLLADHPRYFAGFMATFFGMPLKKAGHPLWGWIGLGLLAASAATVAIKRLAARPPVIVAGGFCALAIGSATLTALGRMNPEDPAMLAARAGRYITEPTLFWCALILLSFWLADTLLNKSWTLLSLAMASILVGKALPRDPDYYRNWEQYFQRGQWAAIGFANGITADAVGDVLFPSREYRVQFGHVLADNGLAYFAGPETKWIGQPLCQALACDLIGTVSGDITTVKKIGEDFEVQGWTDPAATVVFADGGGRIVGFGAHPGAGPAEFYTRGLNGKLAFAGFIRGAFGAKDCSLWRVDGKTRAVRVGQTRYALPAS